MSREHHDLVHKLCREPTFDSVSSKFKLLEISSCVPGMQVYEYECEGCKCRVDMIVSE